MDHGNGTASGAPVNGDPVDAEFDTHAGPGDDRLHGLRERLEAIDEVPVSERLAVFESVDAELAAELAKLDEL